MEEIRIKMAEQGFTEMDELRFQRTDISEGTRWNVWHDEKDLWAVTISLKQPFGERFEVVASAWGLDSIDSVIFWIGRN